MSGPSKLKRRLLTSGFALAPYLAIAAVSLLVLHLVTGFMSLSWSKPLCYSGDGLWFMALIKIFAENHTFPLFLLETQNLGFPTGFSMGGFPTTELLSNVMLWVMTFFTDNAGLVSNLYYFLGFPLIAMSFAYVARELKLSWPIALVFGVLYTFLPIHLLRLGHTYLVFYACVPLSGLLVFWQAQADEWTGDRLLRAKIISALVATTGIYYAFFHCYFFCIATLMRLAATREHRGAFKKSLKTSGLLLAITLGMVALQLFPYILYQHRHPEVPIQSRQVIETEIYPLKLTNLLLPLSHHRIPLLASFKTKYFKKVPYVEGVEENLGLIAGIGFLIGIFTILFDRKKQPGIQALAGFMIVFGVLYAMVGGFSYFFSAIVNPGIRATNRIGVFIGFFALIVAAVFVSGKIQKNKFLQKNPALTWVVLFAILILGVLDQTAPDFYFTCQKGSDYAADETFVQSIEAQSSNSGSNPIRILQLPYLPFPESPPIHEMVDYSHFMGYIHSTRIQWSYGVYQGTDASRGIEAISGLPPEELIKAARTFQFTGIWIDRFGYEDHGKKLISDFQKILNQAPIQSEPQRLVYFRI